MLKRHLFSLSLIFESNLYILQNVKSLADGSRVINSVLEGDVRISAGAVVQHCHLQVWRIKNDTKKMFYGMLVTVNIFVYKRVQLRCLLDVCWQG